MLAHCVAALKVANNEAHPPRLFLGRIIGSFFRKNFYNETPFQKSTPTDDTFIVSDKRDFEKEKQLLIRQINRLRREAKRRSQNIRILSLDNLPLPNGALVCGNIWIITCGSLAYNSLHSV